MSCHDTLDHFSIIFAIKLKGIELGEDQKEHFIYKRNFNETCTRNLSKTVCTNLGIQ